MLRLFIFVIIASMAMNTAFAQQLSVLSCTVTNQDSTALTLPRYDLNGDLAAVVKFLYTGKDELTFKGTIVGNVVSMEGQQIVYLIDKTKRIHIYKEQSLPLEVNFVDYPDSSKGVQAGKTYHVALIETNSTEIMTESGSNMLIFSADAPFERLVVNGLEWEVNGKTAKRLMPFGVYSYTAYAKASQPVSGEVKVGKSLVGKTVKIHFD